MILAGASAIVTGGAVRIGREIGRELARAGVNVCVHYHHSLEEALSAVREFEALGVQSAAVQADLAKPIEAAQHIFEQAEKTLGTIRILINNASVFEPGTLPTIVEDHWDRQHTVNLKAPFFLTQEFARRLGDSDEGAVINLVDWRGERPVPGHDAYTIAKSGLVAQTKLLAQELGPRIRVNGVAPGAILPPHGETPEAFSKRGAGNPLKRVGQPGDVAEAVLYLLRASFVTGEILSVTGGQ